MKKLIAVVFIFVASLATAQKQPLATINDVAAILKGLKIEKTIPQDSIVKLDGIILEGANADKYKIVSYVFFVNYDKRMTNDAFTGSDFSSDMKTFFASLEKNCHISFKDIIIKNIETGTSYMIDPLNVTVLVEKTVIKKGQHSKH